jgi:hypothetical protein
MREARLRPEFAHLYPGLNSGQWGSAARVAEAVLANLMLRELAESAPDQRLLPEQHFEFRGGAGSVGTRRRGADGPGSSPR